MEGEPADTALHGLTSNTRIVRQRMTNPLVEWTEQACRSTVLPPTKYNSQVKISIRV